MDFITYLAGEAKMIAQAPVTFLVLAAVLALMAYWLVRHQFADRLESLNSRITLRDDQLASYKEKLSGASPDEAKQRLDLLELQVKALSPRRLSTDQINRLISMVSKQPSAIEIAHDAAAGDAKAFTGDFAVAFQRAGWAVSLPMVMGIGNPPPTGIALQVNDPDNLRPVEALVRSALSDLGLEFDVQPGLRGPHPRPSHMPNIPERPEERPLDVGLLLTTKLT
ncbi:hypothetical protein [Nitratireductor sp. ZSWI3]|uniref:hypothetical protein n=1 Tax=Nitratireductor sp. ZSWI3 TaxID=2966359 RepID=UPI0021504885|nr:hypothetical protein [Nitratireductor sp. ZSWI3]MCR4268751.1 hypothetical protein [Nitratireductor sp. ZSWI3]